MVVVDWREGPRPTRRVSCRPGAEGAERLVVRCVEVWGEGGVMRIACSNVSCEEVEGGGRCAVKDRIGSVPW